MGILGHHLDTFHNGAYLSSLLSLLEEARGSHYVNHTRFEAFTDKDSVCE